MKVISENLNKEQLNIIKHLALEGDILESTASILYKRGIDTPEKVYNFLHPSINNFNNPFLLSGVNEALARINLAKQNGETVVVYGDYDVDGICATTILYRTLKNYGLDVYAVIPERENGYGLSESVIDEVVENLFPDLIITVDCGISGVNEVEYLKDLGVDVIVTDHHEIPDVLPNTTVINCKLKNQQYPFDSLCGAGVAYKLCYALIGDNANKYLDLVALATIADSMPLIGENRDIVFEGVERVKRGNTSRAIKVLLEKCAVKEITATSLAYSIAPRVNAAGRMGNARMGLELFITDDENEIQEICNALVKCNVDRQTECEKLYKEAKNSLKDVNIRKVVVSYGNNWMQGLIGIITAKISEEYNLPTILFSERDGVLHGSARSIDGVNIFEAINYCKDLLIDFGGHAQAAGVTISKENLDAFIEKINTYVENNYSESVFEKTVTVEQIIDCKFSMRFAKELNLLEPYGTGNKKPLFAIVGDSFDANYVKPQSPHLVISNSYIDLMYFNGSNYIDLLCSDAKKTLVFEPNISTFNNREYLKGFVKCVSVGDSFGQDTYLRSLIKAFNNVAFKNYDKAECLSHTQILQELNDTKPSGFGTMFVLSNPENAKLFTGINKFSLNVLNLSERSGKNCVVIGGIPENDDFSAYTKLVYLDKPFCVEKYVNFKTVIVNSEVNAFNLKGLSVDRTALGKVFKDISSLIIAGNNKSLNEIFKYASGNYSIEQFAFAVSVFTELEFLTYNGVYSVNSKTKKELSTSTIYQGVMLKLI